MDVIAKTSAYALSDLETKLCRTMDKMADDAGDLNRAYQNAEWNDIVSERVRQKLCEYIDDLKDFYAENVGIVFQIIDDAPSIDIVRCKECKHKTICSHSVQHTTHEPTSVTIGYKSIDFCSYGERKDDE